MNKIRVRLVIISISFFSALVAVQNANAATSGKVTIVGKIESIREDRIIIATKSGMVAVPKEAISREFDVRPNKMVRANTNWKELRAFN